MLNNVKNERVAGSETPVAPATAKMAQTHLQTFAALHLENSGDANGWPKRSQTRAILEFPKDHFLQESSCYIHSTSKTTKHTYIHTYIYNHIKY